MYLFGYFLEGCLENADTLVSCSQGDFFLCWDGWSGFRKGGAVSHLANTLRNLIRFEFVAGTRVQAIACEI